MCLASKYLGEFESLFKRVTKDKKMLEQKQSEYDKKLSDIYHNLEKTNFNACEGYYLAKGLQEILQKRRVIKDELAKITSLTQTMNFQHTDNQIQKSKKSISKAKQKSNEWQKNWKESYTVEELLYVN